MMEVLSWAIITLFSRFVLAFAVVSGLCLDFLLQMLSGKWVRRAGAQGLVSPKGLSPGGGLQEF